MYIEHILYSTAIAIIVGLIFSRYTGKDPSWIIIAMAFVPDIDIIVHFMHISIDLPFSFSITHGDFHNIAWIFILSFFVASFLTLWKISFINSYICAVIGITLHLFEDALVENPSYTYLWPISTDRLGIGILPLAPDFFGIANYETAIIGIILVIIAIIVRTLIEGANWYKIFFKGGI
jgi:hypothetical protein